MYEELGELYCDLMEYSYVNNIDYLKSLLINSFYNLVNGNYYFCNKISEK